MNKFHTNVHKLQPKNFSSKKSNPRKKKKKFDQNFKPSQSKWNKYSKIFPQKTKLDSLVNKTTKLSVLATIETIKITMQPKIKQT